MPHQRVRATINARDEIRDPSLTQSLLSLLPPQGRPELIFSEGLPRGLDRMESSSRPLSLGIFVTATSRDTERLVEREYEVLDATGQSLHGRKAREDLRKAASTEYGLMSSDDGFELV